MVNKIAVLFIFGFYLISGNILAHKNSKTNEYLGEIYINKFEDVTVHTYVAKDDFLTNVHIFETENALVVHDVLQKESDCLDLKKYIQSLNKKVKAINISHEHDDHWLGLCYFKEYPVYAAPSTIDYIRREGPVILDSRKKQLAEDLPEELNIPENELLFEDEIIDNVLFRNFQIKEGGPVFLELPGQKILVTHHIMPYGIHPFFPEDIDTRIKQLEKIKAKDYALLLSGHGKPAKLENIDVFIEYLESAKSVLEVAPSYEDVKQNLIELQPTWKAPMLLERSLPKFFSKKEHYPLNEILNLNLNGFMAKASNYQGLDCIEAYWDKKENYENFIGIPETKFTNGTIELEVLGIPGKHAGKMARGFIGIAFRIQNDSTYECIYIRPENGRADNMVRRNHSVQYTSQSDYPWYVQRKETPKLYETYYDLSPNSWTRLKIEVKGEKADLYINNSTEPVLKINDLKLGTDTEGGVGLWIGTGTLARFRNLTIVHN